MKQIFKSYDIRGIYPTEINEEVAERIGGATVKLLQAKSIAIGRDTRASSPSLFAALAKGITDAGADVIDLGLATTPMVYYAGYALDVDGCISLTASHNPPEYNGLKICSKGPVPMGLGSGLERIRDIALGKDSLLASTPGKIERHDISREFQKFLSTFANFGERRFRIAIDTANAMGILDIPLFRSLEPSLEIVKILYGEFDPTFPNHEANPLKHETLAELQDAVRTEHADIGIAFDGDGDRVGFVDEKGDIVPMDLVTALLARSVLTRYPGAVVLADLRSSRVVEEEIANAGGIAHECRVGHAHIKRQMRDEHARLAGELSGHYYFGEGYYAEMGPLPAIYLLNTMAKTGKPLSELWRSLLRYSHSGEQNFTVANTEQVLARIKAAYPDGELSELDGVKVSYPNWWFSVRASNTEPLVRLNLEATTQSEMEQRKGELVALIKGAK
ncbi:MAG TPA: phosphomannomutase/phosphoglucomutase [Candidatus Paceibacterota bacterium]|nr:phosphomannomutase/phosphoglucomutase [Candidatus Paceibacterota bacterium]